MAKTVNVKITTDDGKVSILTGESADVWQRQIEHAGSMAAAHGSQFERLPWVETTVEALEAFDQGVYCDRAQLQRDVRNLLDGLRGLKDGILHGPAGAVEGGSDQVRAYLRQALEPSGRTLDGWIEYLERRFS